MEDNDPRLAKDDPRYKEIKVPSKTECLKDTVARVVPYWESVLLPRIAKGQRLLVVAHGNSLRSLIKHLDGISDDEIVK